MPRQSIFLYQKPWGLKTQSSCRGRTHLKFNIAPLKIGHPKRKPIFQPSIFRGYVKLQVGFPIRGGMNIPNIRSLDPGSFQKVDDLGPAKTIASQWKIITIFARDLDLTHDYAQPTVFGQTQSMTMIIITDPNFAKNHQ